MDWVREHPFLPTAADLIRIMRDALEERDRAAQPLRPAPGYDWAQSQCDQRNARMADDPSGRRDVEWVSVGGDPQLRPRGQDRTITVERVAIDEVHRLNRGLRRFNAPFRYNAKGWPFDLRPGEPDPTDPDRAPTPPGKL
jgi:hypothetical protein